MISAGIGMAARNYECILCRQPFSRMTADAVLSGEMICDECLAKLSQFDEDGLRKHVSQQLVANGIRDKELEDRITRIAQQLNNTFSTGASLSVLPPCFKTHGDG